jgi:hypothetical protein
MPLPRSPRRRVFFYGPRIAESRESAFGAPAAVKSALIFKVTHHQPLKSAGIALSVRMSDMMVQT